MTMPKITPVEEFPIPKRGAGRKGFITKALNDFLRSGARVGVYEHNGNARSAVVGLLRAIQREHLPLTATRRGDTVYIIRKEPEDEA